MYYLHEHPRHAAPWMDVERRTRAINVDLVKCQFGHVTCDSCGNEVAAQMPPTLMTNLPSIATYMSKTCS